MEVKNIILNKPSFSPKKVVLTLGCFDGIHLGHQKLIEEVQTYARQQSLKSCLCVFDPHPFQVLNPHKKFEKLFTREELESLLQFYNLDYFCIIPFDLNFSKMSAESFVHSFIKEHFDPYQMIVGYDFAFGHQREGTVSFLKQEEKKVGFKTIQVPPVFFQDQVISSSRIKEEVGLGHMEEVQKLLGRPFFLQAPVVRGEGRGRQMGIPTANLKLSENKKLPKNGVYSCRVRVNKGDFLINGVMNLGFRPTFSAQKELVLEVHLLESNLDLYGSFLEVEILSFIREEKSFSSPSELQNQIQKDIQKALKNF